MSEIGITMDNIKDRGGSSSAHTITEVVDASSLNITNTQPVLLRLRLRKHKTGKKVGWNADTIDNEEMGKKKSKCCCIFRKETKFGESSSESEDDCENCTGHPEKRHLHHTKHNQEFSETEDSNASTSNNKQK